GRRPPPRRPGRRVGGGEESSRQKAVGGRQSIARGVCANLSLIRRRPVCTSRIAKHPWARAAPSGPVPRGVLRLFSPSPAALFARRGGRLTRVGIFCSGLNQPCLYYPFRKTPQGTGPHRGPRALGCFSDLLPLPRIFSAGKGAGGWGLGIGRAAGPNVRA